MNVQEIRRSNDTEGAQGCQLDVQDPNGRAAFTGLQFDAMRPKGR